MYKTERSPDMSSLHHPPFFRLEGYLNPPRNKRVRAALALWLSHIGQFPFRLLPVVFCSLPMSSPKLYDLDLLWRKVRLAKGGGYGTAWQSGIRLSATWSISTVNRQSLPIFALTMSIMRNGISLIGIWYRTGGRISRTIIRSTAGTRHSDHPHDTPF